MEFVTIRSIHKMSKRKEKIPQGDDVVMVLHQGKWNNPSLVQIKITKVHEANIAHLA